MDARPEDQGDGVSHQGRQPQAQPRVVPLHAHAQGRVPALDVLPQPGERFQRDLPVAVHEEDVLSPRQVEAGPQRLAVAARRLGDHPHARVLRRQPGQDLGRAVAAAVDDEQLGIGHQREDVLLDVADGGLDRAFLVEGRHDDAQPRRTIPLNLEHGSLPWVSRPPVRARRR